jgi:hypothetical protein
MTEEKSSDRDISYTKFFDDLERDLFQGKAPEEQKALKKVAGTVIIELAQGKKDKDTIIKELKAKGFAEASAEQLVNRIEQALSQVKHVKFLKSVISFSQKIPPPEKTIINTIAEKAVQELARNKSIEEQKRIEESVAIIIKDYIENKKNSQALIKKLTKRNLPEPLAMQIVMYVEQSISQYLWTPEGRKLKAAKYKHKMLYGLSLITAGAATLASARNDNVPRIMLFIIIPLFLFGIIPFFKGLFGWLKYRDWP